MKTNHSILLLLLLLASGPCFGQWSTSTKTDSALYICPGFYPDLLTFPDGSSIIFGSYHTFIKARKLDPKGYFLWPNPATVVDNDSALITQHWGGAISDGHGGAIVCYVDNGRSYVSDAYGYENNDLYLQHLDSTGQVLWGPKGILVEDTSFGAKSPTLCSDGAGGVILAWAESSFGYADADSAMYMKAANYDNQGIRRWRTSVDSGRQRFFFQSPRIIHGTAVSYVDYSRGGAYSTLIINDAGQIVRPLTSESCATISWGDSIIFRSSTVVGERLLKIGNNNDTIWVIPFSLRDTCKGGSGSFTSPVIPDNFGGAYFTSLCGDTVTHVDATGLLRQINFPKLQAFSRYIFPDGKGGLVAITDNDSILRYHPDGNPYYRAACFLTDPDNSYFDAFASDQNGGIITAFWTTNGGIYAQHTGRNGVVGVITSTLPFDRPVLPLTYQLKQNYPNPFNPQTIIQYSIPEAEHVRLVVSNTLGQVVKVLVDETQNVAGAHSVQFDGSAMPSGVYFYRLEAAKFSQVKKLLLVK